MSGASPLGGGRGRVTGVGLLPDGVELASYATYPEAQRAVDHLSDEGFPVQQLSIVGSGLRSVERVVGRLDYPRVAIGGAASGAWLGIFVGFLLTLGSSGSLRVWVAAVLVGAGFGMLFGVVRHAATRGQRDFSSVSTVVASRYTVLCAGETARARQLLAGLEGVYPLAGDPPSLD